MRMNSLFFLILCFLFQNLAFAGKTSKIDLKSKTILIYLSGDNNLSQLMQLTQDQLLEMNASEDVQVLILFDGAAKNDSKKNTPPVKRKKANYS